MPFTVLKIHKTVEHQIEVAGEFPEESEAWKFASDAQSGDSAADHDYTVEAPPSYNAADADAG